jgi:DNA-binding transcriptional ArsR family regulator
MEIAAMAKQSHDKIPSELEYTIRDLDQLKVLADPLRIRILEAFCRERTTKQVAEAIEEKPTKLYHHVEALEKVGLIRRSRTKRNRGTLEQYYLAVARTFKTDSRIFEGNTIPDEAKVEHGSAGTDLEKDGILTYLELQADEETIDGFRERFQGLVRDVQEQCAGSETGEGEKRYRMTLAFFPLDPPEPAEDDKG